MPQNRKCLSGVTNWTIRFFSHNFLIGKAKGPPVSIRQRTFECRGSSNCDRAKEDFLFCWTMESPACGYKDWDDEDLQVLDEYEHQEIFDGNPIFLNFTSPPVFQSSSIPVSQYPSIPVSSIPVFQYPSIPVFQYSSIPVSQYSSIPLFQKSSIPVIQYSSNPVFSY